MSISGALYKQIGRASAGSVCVVAARDRVTDAIVGLTASSFVTLSFDPPMVMFALQQKADSYATIVSSKAFGVSLLACTQSHVASIFARKGREKLERTAFAHGPVLQVPLIPDALAQVECLTSQILLSGDHAIVIAWISWQLQLLDSKEPSWRGVRCKLTSEHDESQQSATEPRKIPFTTSRPDGGHDHSPTWPSLDLLVRDVGVAGSNPVTPTIDFINIFYHGCVESRHLVPAKTFFGPVLVPLSTLVERVSSRLSQCDARRRRHS